MFLSSTAAALATVTSLTISVPESSNAKPYLQASCLNFSPVLLNDDPYGLSALASACPAVCYMNVEGSPAPALLRNLGKSVTCFEFFAPRMHHETVEQLNELLPELRKVIIIGYPCGGSEMQQPFNLSRMESVTADVV